MLAKRIRDLSRYLGNDELDAEWATFLRRLRRTMRELVATPLSPAAPVLRLGETIDYLGGLIQQLTHAYGQELIDQATLCVMAIEDLSKTSQNPFGDVVSEVLSASNPASSALLVKSPHLKEISDWLTKCHPGGRTITEFEVPKLQGLDCLVIAGPSLWFPAHILTAPRAETICFVHYDAVTDRPQPMHLLSGSHGLPGTVIRASNVHLTSTDDELDAGFIEFTVDWDALARLATDRPKSRSDEETVPANLFLLAGGFAVYLEASEGPRIDVVSELEHGSTPRLRGESTRSIERGDYIVLRSEGGSGDYIPGIADVLLGRRAKEYRELQRLWKSALRKKVDETSNAQVEKELKDRGIRSPNLRYRLWGGSLRSEKALDFGILMEYVGLGDKKDAIWNAMEQLADAHLKAGQEVRTRLEKKLLDSDPDAILSSGRLDVGLDGMNAGVLSVVRVERRSPDQIMLNEDQLRIMFKVEDDLWQG